MDTRVQVQVAWTISKDVLDITIEETLKLLSRRWELGGVRGDF